MIKRCRPCSGNCLTCKDDNKSHCLSCEQWQTLSLKDNICLDCSDYGVRHEGCPYSYELLFLDIDDRLDVTRVREYTS